MRDHVRGRQDTSAGCVSRDVGDLVSGVLMEWRQQADVTVQERMEDRKRRRCVGTIEEILL